jgi:hypothetical protein
VTRRSGTVATLDRVTRIVLVPSPTPDGRHIILRAETLTAGERLRRFVRGLRRGR